MDIKKGFSCDKPVKDKVINYYKTKAEEKGFVFIEDKLNNNNPYARIDILFAVSSNTIFQNYAIEIKERNNNIDKYEDIMFEEDKIDILKQYISSGYISYFLNVFSDLTALQFDIAKTKYQTGLSYQHKYTVDKSDNKHPIPKVYIKKQYGKWINISQ